MIELLHIDCMKYMKQIPDKHFELAIVDPPFGIGNFWMKNKQSYRYGKEHKWNEAIPGPEYFAELFRISKNQIIWGANYYTDHLQPRNSWIIWDKGISDKTNLSQANLAWTSFNHSILLWKVMWCGAITDNKRYGVHPCEMPVKIYSKLLQKFAKPGDKIFDSHLGSGSIAIACHDMFFDLVGCEIDKTYLQSAIKRLNEHKQQLKLKLKLQ